MKLFKVVVAALVMVGMALPVIAEDRLSLSGEMRVRGWYRDIDKSTSTTNQTATWGDQRLRVGGKIAVAEGVSITFRTDITESEWGTTGSGNGFGSGRSGANQQWDRAHIDLNKGNFHLRAGQYYVGYGLSYTVDTQDNGVSMDYKFGDVPVNAFYILDNNNEGTAASETGNNADAWLAGAKVSPKFDKVALDVFVANYKGGNNKAPNVQLIGADVTANFDAIKVMAEIDFFTGDAADNAQGSVDAIGTQGFVDVGFAASDALTIGGQVYYALGTDKDDEEQYVILGNGFGGWDPIFDVGTSLSNEETADWTNPYGAFGSNTGVQAGRLYGSFKLGADTKIGASVAYLEPQEDNGPNNTKLTTIDHAVASTIGVVYSLMENTTLEAQYAYLSIDDDDNSKADYKAIGGIGLFVRF